MANSRSDYYLVTTNSDLWLPDLKLIWQCASSVLWPLWHTVITSILPVLRDKLALSLIMGTNSGQFGWSERICKRIMHLATHAPELYSIFRPVIIFYCQNNFSHFSVQSHSWTTSQLLLVTGKITTHLWCAFNRVNTSDIVVTRCNKAFKNNYKF